MKQQLDSLKSPRREDETHLFLVRLWAEPEEQDGSRWRGKVQNVVYGEANYFSDWPTLIEHLVSMLPDLMASEPAGDAEA